MNKVSREKQTEYARNWRQKNPGKATAAARRWQLANPDRVRATYLKREYGLSLPEFVKLEQEQEGRCAICKDKAALCVDHNHQSKAVRGLLCKRCNSGLGCFNENFSVLIRAADYIRRHEGLNE